MENTATTSQGVSDITISHALMGIGGTNGGASPLPGGITRYCPGANATPEPTDEDDFEQAITEHAITSWN